MKITDTLTASGRLLPTMQEAIVYMQQADADDDYRDPRPLMQLLMRLQDVDARLAGHILTRRTAVLSIDYVIEDAPEDVRDWLGEAVADVLEAAVDVALYGAAAVRIERRLTDGRWTLRTAERLSPDEIDRPTPRREDARRLREEGATLVREPFSDDDWIWEVDTSTWQGGALRRVLVPEILRRDMLQEWANFSRKLKGIIQGIYREGALEEEREAAETALRRAISHNYIVSSDAITFEYHKLISEAAGINFERIIDTLNADIAIGILGQANTPELPTGGGSRAAIQVLNMIRSDIQYADMARATRMAQRLVDIAYRLNVDRTVHRVPWRFRFDWSDLHEVDREGEARAIREALAAGIPLLADEVYDRLGFSRPSGSPDVITQTDSNPFTNLI